MNNKDKLYEAWCLLDDLRRDLPEEGCEELWQDMTNTMDYLWSKYEEVKDEE